jgi:hypothetical protein
MVRIRINQTEAFGGKSLPRVFHFLAGLARLSSPRIERARPDFFSDVKN